MMKRIWLLGLVFLTLTSSASADLGFWSAKIVGNWRHPTRAESYEFRSNARYIFRGKSGIETGWWKIVMPTKKEAGESQEGPVALRLKSRQRTRRLVVDIVTRGDMKVDREFYQIGGVMWRRVK